MGAKFLGYFDHIRLLANMGENKSILRQLTEIFAFYVRCKLGPGYYLKAKLYRKEVPWRDVLGFVSLRQYEKRIYELNDRLYHRCTQNKVIEKALLTTYGQPTPELLGHYHKDQGFLVSGDSLRSKADLIRLFCRQDIGSKLCMKLTESWGGRGFRVIEVLSDGVFRDMVKDEEVGIDELYESLEEDSREGMIIERYLQQHPFFFRLNPDSVNTCRIGVKRDSSGVVHCVYAYLRVGRKGSLVDNSTNGGVIFPIDPATGFARSGHTKHDRGHFYDRHPDSGVLVAGQKLPMFNEAVALSNNVLSVFPGIDFAGCDIAFSNDGPVVLEINIQPDYNDFADSGVPSRQIMFG